VTFIDRLGALDGVFVKICGLTSEADALLAVGMGAAAVGFVFAPSPRQMTPSAVADITKRLPNQIGLHAVQLHGLESAEDSRWIRDRTSCVIKAFPAGHPSIERFDDYGADLLLVDGASPGSGEVFDWRLAEGVIDPGRLIMSGGLHSDNVGAAIAHLRPWGVDVCSGVEASPGVKDPVKLRLFIAAVRAAEKSVVNSAGTAGDDVTYTAVQRGAGGEAEDLFDWQNE
jgi:phosphoribosylanthranilate isomerase